MAEDDEVIKVDCVPEHTYNFNLKNCSTVGHITAMKFTNLGKELKADTKVCGPESPTTKQDIVAVIDYIEWDANANHPVKIEGRVSPAGRNIINEARTAQTGGTEVEMSWVVYEYDGDAKKYCQRFHCDGQPIKMVKTNGTKFDVAPTPDPILQEPVNYRFSASFSPRSGAGAQSLHISCGVNNKFARDFGVEVSA